MSKLPKLVVPTRWGRIDRETISSLRKCLEDNGHPEGTRSNEIVDWASQAVNVSFGWYLVEYVEGELDKLEEMLRADAAAARRPH